MNQKDQESIASFKEKLDKEYQWPVLYTFKFIVPREKQSEVESIFSKHTLTVKESSKGTYVSLTAKIMAASSDVIIDYYILTNKIEGLISL